MTTEIPDYLAPLTGWRTWRQISFSQLHGRREGALHALASDYWWMPGKAIQCKEHDGVTPVKPTIQNGHGLYCFKTLNQLVEDRAFGPVIGRIYIWGQCVEASRGYRAEFAYPRDLVCQTESIAELLRKVWKVPVEVADVQKLHKEMRQQAYFKAQGLTWSPTRNGWMDSNGKLVVAQKDIDKYLRW